MPAADRSRWANSRAPDLDPWREQDACGVGFVARASGHRSVEIARLALQALARVAHRGAAATDRAGDGAGLRTQLPAPPCYREAARRTIERRIGDAGPGLEPFFVCSLSCRTLVYKALLTGTQLAGFFPDLASADYETALAIFHQRYSTNTTSSWPLAQPFRMLAHN